MVNKINIELFDIERYLSSKGIHYDSEGKNVKSGWIGIECPWCDDPSNHLGINLTTKGINCFRCPVKGTIIRLIMKIDGIPLPSAISLIEKFQTRDISSFEKSRKDREGSTQGGEVLLESFSQKTFEHYHAEYLAGRNFDPELLTKKYKLRFTGPMGEYRMRIIVPVYMNRYLVSFTTRDITNKAKIPWLHGAPHRVILSVKNCLYNIDSVEDTAIIVEGVTDVWRIGNGAVGTFGDKYSRRQIYLLRKVRRAFILFDTEPEAQANAERLAYDLSGVVPEVNVFELDKGDPGDLTEDDVKSIRSEIFGRKF